VGSSPRQTTSVFKGTAVGVGVVVGVAVAGLRAGILEQALKRMLPIIKTVSAGFQIDFE